MGVGVGVLDALGLGVGVGVAVGRDVAVDVGVGEGFVFPPFPHRNGVLLPYIITLPSSHANRANLTSEFL